MYLMPLNESGIYFNATQWPASLLPNIYLLAIAYHPLFSNLMYLVYGIANRNVSQTQFISLSLLVRQSNSNIFIQNSTLNQTIKCNTNCHIKVTQYLFIIETQMIIVIYPIDTSSKQVLFNPVFTKLKTRNNYLSEYSKKADIHKDRYVFINQNLSLFGSRFGLTYTFPHNIFAQEILHVGLSGEWVFGAVNITSTTLIFYSCVQCIYNGSLANNSRFLDNLTLMVRTNRSTTLRYRLYQGSQLLDSSLENGMVFWAAFDGTSLKYLVNKTQYIRLQQPGYTQYNSTANNQFFLFYGANNQLCQRTFLQSLSSDYNQIDLFYFRNVLKKVAISDDSQRLAVHTDRDYYNIKQYQYVSRCNDYNASVINGTLFCDCYLYDGIQCASSSAIDNTNTNVNAKGKSDSFPIIGVIGAAVGLVTIGLTIFLIKKYFKKCLKRHRIPWKYNPVQLMSFQI